MLKDVVLKDFDIDAKIFNISVDAGKVVDTAEASYVLKILNVAVVADGTEKWLNAASFFEVAEIEISEHVFKSVHKSIIPVLIYSLENYKIDNVLALSPGSELNLKGRATIGLPDGNVTADVVVIVELKQAFFDVLVKDFASIPAAAHIARCIFKQTAQEKHIPPEITEEIAKETGEKIGITWEGSPFDVIQFKNGMTVELEHGLVDPQTNVTNDDLEMTGKIALAHLKERPDYYVKLSEMEALPVEKI